MKFVDLFLYFSSMESRNKFANIIIYSSNSVLYLLCSLYPTQQCHQIKYFVTLYVISFQLHQFRDQLDVGGAVSSNRVINLPFLLISMFLLHVMSVSKYFCSWLCLSLPEISTTKLIMDHLISLHSLESSKSVTL